MHDGRRTPVAAGAATQTRATTTPTTPRRCNGEPARSTTGSAGGGRTVGAGAAPLLAASSDSGSMTSSTTVNTVGTATPPSHSHRGRTRETCSRAGSTLGRRRRVCCGVWDQTPEVIRTPRSRQAGAGAAPPPPMSRRTPRAASRCPLRPSRTHNCVHAPVPSHHLLPRLIPSWLSAPIRRAWVEIRPQRASLAQTAFRQISAVRTRVPSWISTHQALRIERLTRALSRSARRRAGQSRQRAAAAALDTGRRRGHRGAGGQQPCPAAERARPRAGGEQDPARLGRRAEAR